MAGWQVRRVLATGAAAAAFVAGSVAVAPAASAAVSCSGAVTASKEISYKGKVMGELVVYYNTSNGGTNSACLYHRGALYGVKANTAVVIKRCSQTNPGNVCNVTADSGYDYGDYRYYAGPRGVTGTRVNCVAASGWIDPPGSTPTQYASTGLVGC